MSTGNCVLIALILATILSALLLLYTIWQESPTISLVCAGIMIFLVLVADIAHYLWIHRQDNRDDDKSNGHH